MNPAFMLAISSLVVVVTIMYYRKSRKPQPSLVQLPPRPVPPRDIRSIYRDRTVVFTVTSNQPRINFDLGRLYRRVKNIELRTAIVPNSGYRVNETCNRFLIDDKVIEIPVGDYTEAVSLCMAINQRVVEFGYTRVTFIYESFQRKIVVLAPPLTRIDFDVENSCARILGFERELYEFGSLAAPVAQNSSIQYSLSFMTQFRTTSQDTNRSINNLPASYYTFTDDIPTDGSLVESPNRVNMKRQLFIDCVLHNVGFWDGSDLLARIYIPEDKEEAEYVNRQNKRSLGNDHVSLDKLDIEMVRFNGDDPGTPCDFNGMYYSLQIELTLEDKVHERVESESGHPDRCSEI